ncbi:hypothetical protein HID58_031723 [Brassica napus]|uniref:Uncharacterized protein n=3 Tax=Brassica TaxID=3705 RepID=A0ABQ7XKR8_BRANA|nr:hypothetical protein HID58_084250 [Brassica napus]KAH0908402.1 hypothetical protein HID58_031723 [Brassica napus]
MHPRTHHWVHNRLPLIKDYNMRKILDLMLTIQGLGMEEAVRRALILAFMCMGEEAISRPMISKVLDALDDLVKWREKRRKEHSVWTMSRKSY